MEAAELASVAAGFVPAGARFLTEPFGQGHIHDTYLLRAHAGAGETRYVLQRINDRVFADPGALMHNLARVTAHLQRRLAERGATASHRHCLQLVADRSGAAVVRDAQGGWWRAFHHIANSVTYHAVDSVARAREAARAFGEFQRLLADLPAPRLHETIPDFHVTPRRLARLEEAVLRDAHGRLAAACAEVDALLRRRPLADALLALHRQGELPERITHNDTKLSNVLFDADSGRALCVVDLDTVMPGLAPYDFGDLVRSCATVREDVNDAGAVRFEMSLFEALLRGYLEGAAPMLTAAERAALPVACKLIAFELGVRFLTDHLEGDVYFRSRRPGHNLDRARVQIRLVETIERHEGAMQRMVESLSLTG